MYCIFNKGIKVVVGFYYYGISAKRIQTKATLKTSITLHQDFSNDITIIITLNTKVLASYNYRIYASIRRTFFSQISPSKLGCVLDPKAHYIQVQTWITFNFIVSCATMCRESSRFSLAYYCVEVVVAFKLR